MIVLGVILIILASVLDLKPPGGRTMMVCGIVLLIVGVVLAVAARMGSPLVPFSTY